LQITIGMKEKINKWFLLLIVSFFLLSSRTFPQNNIEYMLRPAIGGGLPQIGKIIFHDSTSSLKKTFDVLKKNPFNNYHFRKLGKNQQENYNYLMSFDEVNKIIPSSFREGYTKERRALRGNRTNHYNGSSYYGVYKKSKDFPVISYTFYIGIEDYTVGTLGSIVVFNKSGNRIYED
jgi:hypothetical protein